MSFWTAGFLEAYLFETSPFEPIVWTAAAAAVLAAAFAGGAAPAVRASRLDPVRVLRTE